MSTMYALTIRKKNFVDANFLVWFQKFYPKDKSIMLRPTDAVDLMLSIHYDEP